MGKNIPVACHQPRFMINPILSTYQGFPGGSDSQEPACNAGDPGLIPGLGKSPGEGNGNTLQLTKIYFCTCMLTHVQLSATLWTCNSPGSSLHGILQVRILEWIAISSSRGSSQCRNQSNWCLLHLLHWQVYSFTMEPP